LLRRFPRARTPDTAPAWPEAAPVSNPAAFEAAGIEVFLDNNKLAVKVRQSVVPHGIDRSEIPGRGDRPFRR
jgi:hypothetical protein